jgi:CRISPR-associated protein Cmr5
MSQTLDQQRARFAWECTANANEDFKNRISGAPSLIMTNGLMQALAYYKDKGHEEVWEPIVRWLAQQWKLPEANAKNNDERFKAVMKKLHEGSADAYFFATEEALAIVKWIRQYAKARVGKGKSR